MRPIPYGATVGCHDDLPTTPKTKVKVEGDEAPTASKAKAEPVTVVDDEGDLDIDGLDFDD